MAETPRTPLRELDLPLTDGYRVLSGRAVDYSDGGEEDIARILAGAADLSSTSDELAALGDSWIRRYHLAIERGNVVRGLDVEDSVVLEIGAGCGAVTRCLGERARAVDALEPAPARARCAALRTRDLPGVAVFCGGLEAIPVESTYDVIVIVGVLEYVGGGGEGEERAAFLRRAAELLRPGGAIVCAIENRLGVKYLAGAPEDHSSRPFEGLEGYPHGAPYRTFSRQELQRVFAAAGLTTRVLHAFPDYKTPRVVFSDELLGSRAASLAWNLPRFPSRDSPLPRGRLAAEGPTWRGLVTAGLGGEFANSLIVVATRGDGAPLWPVERLAVYWPADRAAAFLTQTTAELRPGEEVVLRRTHLTAGPDRRRAGPLSHHCTDTPFVAGQTLTDALALGSPADRERLLALWRGHVDGIATGGATPLDPLPDNFILTSDGELHLIDDEWTLDGADARFVLERGLLSLAWTLADRCPPEAWAPAQTVGDLLLQLGEATGLGPIDLDALTRREAELQALVSGVPWDQAGGSGVAEAVRATFQKVLDRPLTEMQLGTREPEMRAALQIAIEHERARSASLEDRLTEEQQRGADLRRRLEDSEQRLAALEADLHEERGRSQSLDEQLRVVYASRTWRLGALPRRVAAFMRPSR